MSNYYCPRCGKTVIDTPGGDMEQGTHWCTPKYVIDTVFPKK